MVFAEKAKAMRKTPLFITAAIIGAITIGSVAQAGPLGGLGGSVGGNLGGGLGGVTGSIDGAASVDPGQAIDPVTGAATGVVRDTHHTVDRTTGAVVALPPRVVVAAQPRVGYIRDLARVRRVQSAALIAGGVTVLSEPDAYIYMDRQADELRGALAGTGVDVERQGDAIVLQLPSDVTFAFDKSDIRDRFFPVLTSVAQTLNKYPATYVDVIGYTDAIGSVAYNQALSERRAAAVAGFIQQRESIPARLYTAGRGKSEPIASNATVEGRAANRRVEILLHPYTG